jgi:Skp family chaperone for outer membrane proteins
MKLRILTSALLSAAAVLGSLALDATASGAAAPRATVEVAAAWICDRTDNICGLDDPRMLSNPAKVDYDALCKATPEYKKIRDEKIDPNSSEGIQLRQRAADRIRDAAETVRSQKGYCSVWKAIRHQDGRSIPDITEAVKALL